MFLEYNFIYLEKKNFLLEVFFIEKKTFYFPKETIILQKKFFYFTYNIYFYWEPEHQKKYFQNEMLLKMD